MKWPDVAIGIITYDRPTEIRMTLLSLVKHIQYSGKINLFIADDSSPGTYRDDLVQWWIDQGAPWDIYILKTNQNGGWGVNANNLIFHAFKTHSFAFFQEDDYVLTRPLDMDVGVALMECEPNLGMLRYRATGGAPIVYKGRETNINSWIPDYREYCGYGIGQVQWLELDGRSESLWLYSNGPHLRRASFHETYGTYPEGLKLGMTEEVYAHMVIDRIRTVSTAPKIGVLPEWIYLHFDHIGISYQHTPLDKG